MIKTLKKAGSLEDNKYAKGYYIIKFPHPEANKSSSIVDEVKTLEEAQEICSCESSSFKEGPEKDWYFLGYSLKSSKSSHITLW